MKKITVLLFLAFVLIIFGGTIGVEERSDGIYVITKFMEYKIGYDGNIHEIYRTLEGRRKVFTYSNDGFDITSVSTPSYKWNGLKSSDNKYSEITLTFNYEFAEKTYHFEEGPNYTFDVYIKASTSVEISIPRVGYPQDDRIRNNIFVSYYNKGDYISIIKFTGKTAGQNKVVGTNVRFLAYIGPYKKTLIKSAFEEDYTTISEMLKTVPGVGSWYDPIKYGLAYFFSWINNFTKNFGLTIIIFTIIVRLILYPLYHAQTKSMIKMRKIQPQIEVIKKKYKDPQKQQQELLKIYRENKINPASGCLMALIQLPIFIVLYQVIRYFQEEFAFSGSFLIWKDLTAGGFSANWIFLVIQIVAGYFLALIMSQDSRTAWQSILMSVFFPFLFIGFPSGVFLYYTTNTLIQLATTYYIYKKYKIKGITQRELWGLPNKG
ncbi:YidC/Oxa1 family membrane protein insertase [Thermosipho ferrireducens]|uniref:YidC/Oxa1 family membrane protein insertase n=1 Tax=Thermosipho ferrireducens TaxID=2571116 RepID=A0ABX7S6Q5_9BACT|nr:membrane protein insertase YidC [Thermosipho ferrireducens]QTA37521.1 YidC/Oxa1 family membrane protein insertase [Thermosipho ferrireducens]